MPGRNLTVDGRIGGTTGKVRKRGCLSSSSSSFGRKYRLKHTFLVGKKGGSTTPAPMWKMISSKSPSLENDNTFKHLAGVKAKELPASARKLAAIFWEINGLPSPRSRRDILEEKTSEVGIVGKERNLESSRLSSKEHTVSERTDLLKLGSTRRRALSASSRKLLQSDCNLGGATSLHNCLVQVYQTKNHIWSPGRRIVGIKNCLKDVYDGLTTSKELLKVLLSLIRRLERQNSTSSLVSVLEFEIEQACTRVGKLIHGLETGGSDIDQFEKENVVSKIKEREMMHIGITSVAGELEMHKKLRRQTEKRNQKLVKELAQAKASASRAQKELESEKKAREMVEQVCDELARCGEEDRAEVETLKKQSAKLREELDKERQMLQLADMLREERVQMKLSEAKYQFEEKNAIVDELRNEFEAYLISKTGKEQADGCPSYEKIKVLEQYLRDTFPGTEQNQDKDKKDIEAVNEEVGGEGDDSDDSDLHSIELNMDDITKSLIWGDAVKNVSKRNSVDKCKGRKSSSEKTLETNLSSKPKFADAMALEFTSHTSTKDTEDEMKRYKMIKDLRDHIVSAPEIASSQDSAVQDEIFASQVFP